MWSHDCWKEESNQFPWPPGHASANAAHCLLAITTAMVHCWFLFNLLSTRTLQSFSPKLLFGLLVKSLLCFMGLLSYKCSSTLYFTSSVAVRVWFLDSVTTMRYVIFCLGLSILFRLLREGTYFQIWISNLQANIWEIGHTLENLVFLIYQTLFFNFTWKERLGHLKKCQIRA